MTHHRAAFAPVLLAAVAGAQPVDFSPVTDPIAAYVAQSPAPGAALLVERFDGTVLNLTFFGAFDGSTVIRIGSATKWISGTALAALEREQRLDFAQPVREVLSEFDQPGAKGDMTIAQLFSHTSGLPGSGQSVYDWSNRFITLEESVRGVAEQVPLRSLPGAEFNYGGMSMQVAGRMAEVGTATPFEQLVAETVFGPLGMADTDYKGLGPTTNPRVAGGARSSLSSYRRLLRALVTGGLLEGERVLPAGTTPLVLADATGGASLAFIPSTIDGYLGYGVGNFVLRRDAEGDAVEFASPGAFGTYPWIDTEHRYFGLFMIDEDLDNADPLVDAVRAFVRALLDCPADINSDGRTTFGDTTAFIAAFNASSAQADANRDGDVSFADAIAFIESFNAGCP